MKKKIDKQMTKKQLELAVKVLSQRVAVLENQRCYGHINYPPTQIPTYQPMNRCGRCGGNMLGLGNHYC